MKEFYIVGRDSIIASQTSYFNVFGRNTFAVRSSVIGNGCSIGNNVRIGNDCKIGNNVTIGNGINIPDGTVIGDNVTIIGDIAFQGKNVIQNNVLLTGNLKIGTGNIFMACCVIGTVSPRTEDDPTSGFVVIGDGNKFCQGTVIEGGLFDSPEKVTSIGDENYIMGYVKVPSGTKIGNKIWFTAKPMI